MSNLPLVVVSIFLSIIVFFAFFFLWRNIKNKTRVFSIKKMTIMASFFAIFVLQNFIFLPLSKLPLVPWSMESVTVIAVGFLFGPLEGIVYGFLADIIGVLISGNAPLFLYSIKYPLIGLISGVVGIFWRKYKNLNRNYSFLFTQISTFILIITPFIFISVDSSSLAKTKIPKEVLYSTGALSFVILELISIFFYKKRDNKNMMLFSSILFIAISSRIITGWIIHPLADYHYWKIPFGISQVSRIITSTYLTPATAVITYGVVNASIYAMKVTDYYGEN